MKKRIFSFILAALMCMSLCAGACAAGGGPDLKEAAWKVALNLSDAADSIVSVDGKLSGKVTGTGYEDSFNVYLTNGDAAFADGTLASSATFKVIASASQTYLASIAAAVPDVGVYCGSGELTEIGRYDEAPDDAFCDFSTAMAMHLAALGDDLLGAQESDGALAYELAGDDLHDFIMTCFPELVGDCELDWSQITAQMTMDPDGESAEFELSSPSLAEAILNSLPDVQSVENCALDLEIEVKVLHEDDTDYEGYYVTEDIMNGLADEDTQIVEVGGKAPEGTSLKDAIWSLCEEDWAEAAETESAKDALRAQMNGQAPAEEEAAPVEEPGE